MRRRSGMTLVLVLLVMLIGGAFVYVAFSIAENAHNSSMNMVTQDRLYNAAQSGLEWGKAILWIYRDDLEEDQITGVNSLDDTFARKDNGTDDTVSTNPNDWLLNQNKYPDGTLDLPPIPTFLNPQIQLIVQILDCNYEDPGSYIEGLPPLFSAGDSTGSGATTGLPGGTSAIIDPGRFIPLGGGAGEHRYVIRSEASIDGKTFSVETMVVMTL